jgi:hypothetical protein
LANRVTEDCGAAHFSQSASTMKSGNTSLILNFGYARLKKDKETLSTRLFRKNQGSRQEVKVCVLWGNIK